MKKISGSVLRQLLIGMTFVTLALTAIIWLTQSLRFVDMIINHGLTPGLFIELTVLLLPHFLTVVLPIALFTVVVFVYAKLTTDRELVVMSAAGLSPVQIARPAIFLATVVIAVGYLINIYILPESYRLFGELKWHIRYNYSQVLLQDGTFNTVGGDTTVYIRERTPENELRGIFVHDQRDPERPVTLMAKRGSLVKTDDGAVRVVMFDGSRQVLDKGADDYSILFFDRYSMDLTDLQQSGGERSPDTREMTMHQLFNIEGQPYVSPHDYPKFKVEAHKRLISPFAALSFALVGVVCMMAGGFTRRNQSKRVMAAVLVMISLEVAMLALENLSARNLTLVPLMYAVVIAPIVLGFLLLLRPPRLKFLT